MPQSSRPRRQLQLETLEARHALAADWQNPTLPQDVNDDHYVTQLDALHGLIRLNETGAGPLGHKPDTGHEHFYDVDGNGQHTPLDVLLVLNALNRVETGGLEATLVARQDTYTLNPAQQGEAFRRWVTNREFEFANPVDEGPNGERSYQPEPAPRPPAVDLVLKLTNTSDRPLLIVLGSDISAVQLRLQGPGALAGWGSSAMTLEFRCGEAVEIAPGQSHEIAIRQLKFGNRNNSYAYWTEPGEYTLTAWYQGPSQYPCDWNAPPADSLIGGRSRLDAVSNAVKLTVLPPE